MHNNIVCYLFTKFDDKQNLINFIKNYKKNNSGFFGGLPIATLLGGLAYTFFTEE